MGAQAPEAPGVGNPAIGRSLLVRLLREFRPGVYVLNEPLAVPSDCNFWEQEDADCGGCSQRVVGTPIRYFLHVVRIKVSGMWEGYDEPVEAGLSGRSVRVAMARNGPALSFTPAVLAKKELMFFLLHARRVAGLSGDEINPEAPSLTGRGLFVSTPNND